MKSRKVRDAYNSINPTQEQKDRMLSAILSQLPEENTAPKHHRKKIPRNQRFSWGTIAAGFAILIVTGILGFGFFSGKAKPGPANPKEEASLHETILINPGESVTGNAGYDHIVKKYVTALTENWTWEQCEQNDISRQIMFDTTNKGDLGWCLLDLDRNGTQELLVSDGIRLIDLYTIMPTDGNPGHLVSAYPYDHSLCKDGTIERRENHGTNTYWRWFEVQGIDLAEQQVLYLEGEAHAYSLGSSDQVLTAIPEGKAGEILTGQEKAVMELVLIPFVEQEFPEYREANFYYEDLIEKYRQAILEDWNPGKCIENGISLMIGYYGEYYEQLGHIQIDLNGDQNAELIITDGTNIYDLYTISHVETGEVLRLVDATERNQFFLTTEGLIYNMGSGGAMLSYHTLYSMGEKELNLVEGYLFDPASDPKAPWYYYDGEERGESCPNSVAGAATDAIVFAEISYIPFT